MGLRLDPPHAGSHGFRCHRGGVVVAKHLKLFEPASGDLCDEWEEVVGNS